MATSLISTGVQFPDNTIQTVAATSSTSRTSIDITAPAGNMSSVQITGIPLTANHFVLNIISTQSAAPVSKYPRLEPRDSAGNTSATSSGTSFFEAGSTVNPMTGGIYKHWHTNKSDIIRTDQANAVSGNIQVEFIYQGYINNTHQYFYIWHATGSNNSNNAVGGRVRGNGKWSSTVSKIASFNYYQNYTTSDTYDPVSWLSGNVFRASVTIL